MPKLFQPEQIQLSNGIPVILQHYDSPVAATYWWIKTGSGDEAPHEAGFAHFLEHMLFKDTAAKETGRASTGEMARAIESLGGDINAYTSFDQTVYHVTCAAHHWERVIDAFGTMAKPQRFLKDDFDREREVILEELRKNEDAPGRQLFQNLFSLTFKKHPYGKPVIGYVKTLKAAKVAQLEAFYRRNYVTEKMGLVLVGPIHDEKGARKKQIIKFLEKHYGSKVLKKRAATPVKRALDAPLAKGDLPPFKVMPFDVKTPTVSVSFRAPDLTHEDTPALDLMSGILGMGELSRLYQRLFYQTSLATDASGGLYTPRDPGMLYFQFEASTMDKIQPAAEELFKELARIKAEGPTPEELSRVIVNAESEKLYATQTADGMAGRLGFLRFILGDMDYDQKFIEELRSIDAARIREVASTYLDPRRMSIVVLVPKDQESYDASELSHMARKLLGAEDIGAKQAEKIPAKARVKSKSVDPSALPVEFIELDSGMRVAYFERPQSHVFSVHASALGGLRMELTAPVESAERDWGSSHLMALTWTKGVAAMGGARGLNAREIAGIVEGSAAGMDGFSGRNSVGLQMTGLSRDWGKLSSLFSQALASPTFPKDEVDHSRRIVEDSIRSIEDHTSQLCSKLFLETLYENHPYGKLTYGTLESVAAIDSEKLQAFHRQWIRPERLTVAVSGPVKRASLESWLRELEDRVRDVSQRARGQELPESLPDENALKGPRWVERSLGREQTHILVGGLGTRIFAEDRHAVRLLQTLLGGQSGRLFIELREKKSLAYTVAPVSFEGLERGYIGTYIACSPGKRQEAIEGIKKVLETLAAKGPTAAEMNRAKEFYLGRRAMDMQSDSAIASHYGLETLYGVEHMSEKQLVKKIESISANEIRKVCKQYLVDPFMVTSVVG
jgi:zinc protease